MATLKGARANTSCTLKWQNGWDAALPSLIICKLSFATCNWLGFEIKRHFFSIVRRRRQWFFRRCVFDSKKSALTRSKLAKTHAIWTEPICHSIVSQWTHQRKKKCSTKDIKHWFLLIATDRHVRHYSMSFAICIGVHIQLECSDFGVFISMV